MPSMLVLTNLAIGRHRKTWDGSGTWCMKLDAVATEVGGGCHCDMPPPKDDFTAFCLAIDGTLGHVFDATARIPPSQSIRAPSDWPSIQSALRDIAANLMLCTEVRAATESLTEDQAALRCVAKAISGLSLLDNLRLYRIAYKESGPGWHSLPGSPMAHFLLAVCDYTHPPASQRA
jgi:hypothetical protein